MADFFDEPPQSSGTYTSTIGLMGGGGASPGGSSSEQQSTSTPTSVTSPQTDWGLMQSQLLSALADRTYNWAMDQYAKGEGVTDQTIANFLEMSGKGKGLADTLLHQYQDQIKPLMDNYIREAGTYASEGRQRFEAGKAMSTVGQADTAAMAEIERKLEGQGINVNSGRIQQQMIASRVADAAARAGAGTEAANRTQDIGRQMTEKGIAMGQQIPGQAVGAIQSAYAGLTGAENAILGLLNTGKNLADAAAPYHQAAVAANKVPPVGQTAQSTGKSASQQATPQGGGGGGGGSKAAPKGEGGGRQPAQPRQPREGGGGGGGRGDGTGGGDGGRQMGIRDTGAYGKEYRNPLQAGGKKEEEEATGAPDPMAGYQGPIGYVDETGTVYPEMSPSAGTTTWEQALENPAPPAWTLPEVGSRGFNVDPASAGGDNPQLGQIGNLNATWDSALENALPVQGGYQYDPRGEQNFATDFGGGYQYDPRGEQNFATDFGGGYQYDPGGEQNFATDFGGGYQYDPGGEQNFSNYDPWGGQQFDEYQASESYPDEYQAFQSYPDEYQSSGSEYYNYPDEYQAFESYPDEYQAYESYPDEYQSSGSEYYNYPDEYQASESYPDEYQAYDNTGYDDYSDYGSGEYYSGGAESYGGGYEDYGGEDYGDYTYAQGGRVRPDRGVMPTTGGAVPRSASPSQGRQTDDISARLNAGEYVIPRDVVKHQGTKFFSDLIAKSRKLRTGMTGAAPKPTMRPALPQGRPTFSSRPLPPR